MNIKIVYETQNGTTQYVAETILHQLQAAGHQVYLHSIKYDGAQPNLDGMDLILVGAPTYDDGKLEKTMLEFIQSFQVDFTNRKVAVFGLGNSTYPLFCRAADILEEWVRSKGGAPLVSTLRVDGFPDELQPIIEWTKQLQAALQ